MGNSKCLDVGSKVRNKYCYVFALIIMSHPLIYL
jgi:hypothetical protein